MKNLFRLAILSYLLIFATSCSKDKDTDPIETLNFTGVNTKAANLTIRVIYLVPSDRSLKKIYIDGAKNCITQLTTWYKGALGSNKTFHINNDFIVETIQSSHNAAWFNANNGTSGDNADYYFYQNTKNDIKSLLGASYNETNFTYLVYVDAQGKTGAGALSFTAMPETDLLGLTGQMTEGVPRWIGGAGHELGHAFGLPHPDNQNANALMWTGYTLYPNCILQDNDKAILNGNKFFY
ncbi:hypothetical protein GM921_11615 [Pedobacter sp. LMG 31464]|uniref:Dual-action HEIGH metallo-peptidase n=1 Tax=Pedobacter planticolens TaxID=2679964 RepID=A0A923DY12_9SPHI|nr:hypothetical protein [Pedobacter planticolens]MBB2146136.1 hypothetical protein [Pedobacter planticolens]